MIIDSTNTIEQLRKQKTELKNYIRWAEKQMNKTMETGVPVKIKTIEGIFTLSLEELDKDIHDARLQLWAIGKTIEQKQKKEKRDINTTKHKKEEPEL